MTQIIYTPIIDGNKSIFLYKSNIFEPSFKERIESFLDQEDYCDGQCVSGKEIPKSNVGIKRRENIFVIVGKIDIKDGSLLMSIH